MIKLVVFDMAGTTIDEDNVVYKCLHQAILPNIPNLTLENVLLHGAGKEKKTAVMDICAEYGPVMTPEDIELMFEQFKMRLAKAYDEFPLKLYHDARDLFIWLKAKGIKIAFNTGYDRLTAEKILKKANVEVGRDIDILVTASDVHRNRPYPDMIYRCCDITAVNPSESIKIGDSAIDIEEGKSAGAKLTIGITTGAQTRDQIAKASPDFIIDALSELKAIIEK
jgi:phosphonatase-like hydrolase